MAVKPAVQALLLADNVECDPDTGKITVAGIFDLIEVRRPETHFTAPAFVFLALKNIHREVEIVIRYRDLSDNRLLLQFTKLVVQNDDRLATATTALRFTDGIPVPHSGVYSLELHFGNEMLASVRVVATVIQEDEQPDSLKEGG